MKHFLRGVLRRAGVREDEAGLVASSALMFFLLMGGYFLVRPLRDALGIGGDEMELNTLIYAVSGVMILAVPVYGLLVRQFPRRVLVPWIFRASGVLLACFFLVFAVVGLEGEGSRWPARVFFVFVSVYNLFVVSVFWSVMADVFRLEQGKRLFALVSIGGTIGALGGSALVGALSGLAPLGGIPVVVWGVLISALTLELSAQCFAVVERRMPPEDDGQRRGPSIVSGLTATLRSPYLLGVCAYMMLSSIVWTLLYLEQGAVFRQHLDTTEQRSQLFAIIDVSYNALTLVLQLFLAGHAMRLLGVTFALVALPVVAVVGFLALGAFSGADSASLWYGVAPAIWAFGAFQVVRRGVHYGLSKPARSALFTVVDRDEKYKAKCFIDTCVYRAGDAAGTMVSDVVNRGVLQVSGALAIPVGSVTYVAAGFASVWAIVGFALGRSVHRRGLDVPAGPADATPEPVQAHPITPSPGVSV